MKGEPICDISGGGCGFVKDDDNGKGTRAKGEGLTLMIMLIIALAGIAIARRVSIYNTQKQHSI